MTAQLIAPWALTVVPHGVLPTVITLVMGVGAASIVLVIPGMGLLAVLRGRYVFTQVEALGVVFLGSGTTFACSFWAAMVEPVSARVLAVAVVVVGTMCWARWPRRTNDVAPAFLLAAAVAIMAVGCAFAMGGLEDGDHAIAKRYWLSPDNRIPAIVAHRLVDGESLRDPPILPGWRSTDRPPLQVGAYLPFVPSSSSSRWLTYDVVATALQAWWVPPVLLCLIGVGIDRRTAARAVLLLSTTGVIYFNTIFVWPKLLAGALALAAAGVVFMTTRPRVVLIGPLLALAMLAHGGAVFAVPTIAGLLWMRRRGLVWRDVLVAGALSIALYVPWMALQRFYDPPGDRLLRWHLAGDLRVEGPSLGTAVWQSYAVPPGEVVVNKVRNLAALVGTPWRWRASSAHPAWTDLYGQLRTGQLDNVLVGPGVLLVGLVASAWDRRFRPLVVLSAGTALTSAILEHGGSWAAAAFTLSTSYVGVLSLGALAATGVLLLPRMWRRVVIATHAIAFLILWFSAPIESALVGDHARSWNLGAITAALIGAAAGAAFSQSGLAAPEGGAPPSGGRLPTVWHPTRAQQ